MLTKKKPTKSKEQDEAELDSAMKELVKQTEALLGSSDDEKENPVKKTKPAVEKIIKKTLVSPKKKIIPHTKGKNFDIVSRPQKSKKIAATLKTAVAVKGADAKLLLAESVASNSVKKDIQHSSVSSAKIVHQKGNLHVQETASDDDKASYSTLAPQSAPSQNVARTGIVFSQPDDIDEPGSKTVSFFDESDDDIENTHSDVADKASGAIESKTTNKQKIDVTENDSKDSKLSEKSTESDRPASQDSGELYANNLISDKKPRGYVPLESQEKPTVFDTTQYHVELHDWSKLDKSFTGKWLILGLLLILLVSAIYLFVFKQPLPFIDAQ